MNRFTSILLSTLLACLAAAASPAPLTLALETDKPGPPVSPDFTGLSFEIQKLLPAGSGQRYFSPSNKRLIALFKNLGIKNLRVGGNTADNPAVAIPAEADIDELFAFAKSAGVKIIYTVRLKQGDPQAAAKIAKYIYAHYRAELDCLQIGNEPNVFAKQYPVYLAEWKRFEAAIAAEVPDAKFCGPSGTPGKTTWARDFANDLGPSGCLAFISQHDYPGASAKLVNTPEEQAAARDKMLSGDWEKYYEKFYNVFVPTARSNGLSVRLEEANSFFHGGAAGASDTYASALWGLDYMLWWASHGGRGINFHTGDAVASGNALKACKYAVFLTTSNGFSIHPLGYALKTFELMAHGRFIPVHLADNPDAVHLTTYAVQGPDALYVMLINKEHGPAARAATVTLPASVHARAQILSLTAPEGDLSATTGLTLGGSPILDSTWTGTWTPLAAQSGALQLILPPATATLVKTTAN